MTKHHNSIPTRRSAGSVRLVLRLALTLSLLAPLVASPILLDANIAVAQTSEVAELATTYNDLSGQLESLRDARRSLETKYEKVTARISANKRSGNNLIKGIQLESLLEEARVLANRLYGVQEQIREVEKGIESTRTAILAVYDRRIGELEDRVVRGGSGRSAALAELNKLLKERHQYRERRQTTPDLNLANIPTLDEVPQDPEEMLATAAELDDTEKKLRDRIGNLDASIADLEKSRRLRRRARAFRDREAFFDDAVPGARRIARGNTGTLAAGDAGPTGDKSRVNAGAEGNNGATGALDDGDAAEGESPALDGDAAPPEARDDDGLQSGGVDPNSAPGFSAGGGDDGGVTVGTPGVLPGTGAPGDPFGNAGVVVKSDVENNDFQVGTRDGDEPLEKRLKRLKKERERLDRKAKELRDRSDELKVKAGEF